MPADDVSPPSADSQWSAAFAGASVDSMRVYDSIIARLFTPWAHDLIDRLAPSPGPAMLDIARSKPIGPDSSAIEWLDAPAEPLPVADSAVDIITCQQGLQFFPDKVSALAEMRRVLRSGGRAGVAVWTRVEDRVFGYLRDAIANVISNEIAERYRGPFLLSGEDAADYALRAGFDDVNLERVTLPALLPGGAQELLDTWRASGIAPDIAALEKSQRADLLAETMRLTEALRDGDALRGSLTASVLVLS